MQEPIYMLHYLPRAYNALLGGALVKSICCGYSFELIDRIDWLMQFKWVPTTYAFINK